MKFTVEIDCNNAAFVDHPHGAGGEVARLLRVVAEAVERGTRGAPLYDENGNRCGRFDFKLGSTRARS